MTRCIALYKMDIVPQLSNSIVNEGEHNSMKSTYKVFGALISYYRIEGLS